MLRAIIEAFIATPWWVWFLLVYLIFLGVKSFKTHIVFLPKLFIVPLILFAIKYEMFISADLTLLTAYFICLLIGLIAGFIYGRKVAIKIADKKLSIVVPGTYLTFVLLITIFCIKYVFAYLHDVNPVLATEYAILETTIIALFTGFSLGRTLAYVRKHINATVT